MGEMFKALEMISFSPKKKEGSGSNYKEISLFEERKPKRFLYNPLKTFSRKTK
jgi:hypothetical protein